MKRNRYAVLGLAVGIGMGAAQADEERIRMHRVTPDGVGAQIGSIGVRDSRYGAVFTPRLHGLAPGAHGFHLHRNADCGPGMKGGSPVAGLAAGGHFDPRRTGRHAGPYRHGHLGDLPVLYADAAGDAVAPVLAPRLRLRDLRGHALMIHAGGDNYADSPAPLGGGGARVACGVVD